MTSRTVAVESLLVDVRKSLKARIEESERRPAKRPTPTLARERRRRGAGRAPRLPANQGTSSPRARTIARDAACGGGHLAGSFRGARRSARAGRGHRQSPSADGSRKPKQSRFWRSSQIESLNLKLQSGRIAFAEAEEAIKPLVTRIAEAEANVTVAHDQIQSLNLKLQCQQADLDHAAATIQSLVERAAAAEANASGAQDEIQNLTLKLQDEETRRAAVEAALRQALSDQAQSDHGRLRGELDGPVNGGQAQPAPQALLRSAELAARRHHLVLIARVGSRPALLRAVWPSRCSDQFTGKIAATLA